MTGNRLLAALASEEADRLSPWLEPVLLEFGTTLREAGEPFSHVYFVDSGMVSLVAGDPGRKQVEVGTIGREGLLGLPALLGAGSMPFRAIVQLAGHARRIPAGELAALCDEAPDLRRLVRLFTHAHQAHAAQNVACNALHSVEQRAARWLLLTYERMGPGFALTQEFLAEMLGVRRPTVSTVASALQAHGLIRYVRGTVTVRDGAGLEAVACRCYRIIHDEFERVLPGSFGLSADTGRPGLIRTGAERANPTRAEAGRAVEGIC
jgi:CRP-like cAMP-binding protein